MPSTAELVHDARSGEKTAFGELVRRYERVAILTAYAILRDYHSAQDVAQEAFLNAYSHLDQLRDAATFGPWMLQIVRRKACLAQKRLRLEQIKADDGSKATEGSEDWLQRYEEVVQLLAQLPEHERTVIVLHYVDGHSVQEVADLIGRPANTVRKQLARAVQRLQTFFARMLT